MKILFCGLKNEYGNPRAGLSFEYKNFFDVLQHMEGVVAELFPFDEIMAEVGRDEMNRRLVRRVEEWRPDLLFCFLFTEELKKETVQYITEKTSTKTFNWFADDHWRFPVYSRHWAPLFTAVSTTDSKAVAKYHRLGITNVIKTQWAANTHLYKPQNSVKGARDRHITFVGKNYGMRGKYLYTLKKHNLPAEGYGSGWPKGRVDHSEMLEIFSFSKINLNFTESPYVTPKDRLKVLAKLFIKKELGVYKFNARNIIDNVKSVLGTQRRQIKGRTFEVPACGGFLLTGEADNIRDYYAEGKEIATFKNVGELVEKCTYYLEHEEERKAIAQAGYERTIKEHTYIQRFKEIFRIMELMD